MVSASRWRDSARIWRRSVPRSSGVSAAKSNLDNASRNDEEASSKYGVPGPTFGRVAQTAPAGMKAPDFMLHTGDITQNSKAAEFDTAAEVIKGFKSEVFYVPGEHDFIDDGVQYKQRSARAPWAMAGAATTTKAFTSLG